MVSRFQKGREKMNQIFHEQRPKGEVDDEGEIFQSHHSDMNL